MPQFQDGSSDVIDAENCCHLVCEHKVSGQGQVLIYSTLLPVV